MANNIMINQIDGNNPSYHQTLKLNDNRTLGYALYGDTNGEPVLYFTGTNSSRLEGAWLDEACRTYNVCLVSIDRPGYGLSDFQPDRTLLSWSSDVTQLADSLGFANFAVLGLSGGGPHALAVAYQIQERLTTVAIVSGTSPYGIFDGMWLPVRLMLLFGRQLPFWFNVRFQKLMNDPDNVIKNKDQLSPPDTAIMTERPEIGQLFRASQIEGMRNGTEGAAQDLQLITQPWGFDLSDITMPIGLWYGENDVNVPVAQGYFLNDHLPNSHLVIVPNEAHFSLINNHIDAILSYLKTDTYRNQTKILETNKRMELL